MKKTVSVIFSALLILGSLAACGEPGPKESESPQTAAPQTPAPRVGVLTARFEYESTQTLDNGVVMMTVGSVTPIISITGREEAAESIQTQLTEALAVDEGTVQEYVEMAKGHYSTLNDKEKEYWGGYSTSRDCRVERGDERLASFSYIVYDYTGGAHGNYGQFGMNFDAETGKLLTADDISSDPTALKNLVADWVLSDTETLKKAGVENPPEDFAKGVMDSRQWCFTNDGLMVWANPYEIASYAAGIVKFTVPYSELDGLLNENYTPVSVSIPTAGELHVSGDDGLAPTAAASAVLDAEGEKFFVWADVDANSISLSEVGWYNDGSESYVIRQLFYISSLTAGESLELTARLTDPSTLQIGFGGDYYLIGGMSLTPVKR